MLSLFINECQITAYNVCRSPNMEAYQGYIENGKVVPLNNATLPDGHRVIITVLDDRVAQPTRAQEQLQALIRFRQGMKETGPLPDEFDEITAQRVN
jgi:hypothetical protein